MLKIELTDDFLNAIRAVVKEEFVAAQEVFKTDEMKTVSTLAEYMQVSTATIRQFMTRGLPYFQEGTVIRFFMADVVSWIKRNEAYVNSYRKGV